MGPVENDIEEHESVPHDREFALRSPLTLLIGFGIFVFVTILSAAVAGSLFSSSADADADTTLIAVETAPITTTVPADSARTLMPTSSTAPSTTTTTTPPIPRDRIFWGKRAINVESASIAESHDVVREASLLLTDPVGFVSSRDASGRTVDQIKSGYSVHLEGIGLKVADHEPFVDDPADWAALSKLGPGKTVLTETSAKLRRIGVGGHVVFASGIDLEVVGVVSDASVFFAEFAVDWATALNMGVNYPRYLFVQSEATDEELGAALADLPKASDPYRIRPRETDANPLDVSTEHPALYVKAYFGEFYHRPRSGTRSINQQDVWVDANVFKDEIPILGSFTCHGLVFDALRPAMEQLEDEGLGWTIDPDYFQGCFNPRLVGPGRGLSRHAWGGAIDINVGRKDPRGTDSFFHPRLNEIMAEHGFISGGDWMTPDPAHFELRPTFEEVQAQLDRRLLAVAVCENSAASDDAEKNCQTIG